jgi:hypothetical protein
VRVGGAVEIETVDVVQLRIVRAALADDAGEVLADDGQRQLPRGDLGGVPGRGEPQLAGRERRRVDRRGAGRGLVHRAVDG